MDWIFVLAVLGLTAVIARSGLLFRVGLFLIRRMPGTLFWQAGTLLLTGLMMTPLLPQNKGRVALIGPLSLAVAQALRLRDREPAAAVLGLAAWIGSGPLMFVFLNGSTLCLLAWGLLPEASRLRFNWIHWLVAAGPLGLFVSAGALVILFLALRPPGALVVSRDRIDIQLAVLGPLSPREVATISVLVLTVIGWVLNPVLHLGMGTVAILGLIASIATGNVDRRFVQTLDWDFIIFYGIVLSMAQVVRALGLDHAAAEVVAAPLQQMNVSPLTFVLAIACLSFLVRFVLPQNQGILLLSLALIPAAPTVGVDPWVLVITLLATSAMWFLPYQTPSYLVAYSASEGRLYSHSQAQRLCFAYAAITLAGLALSVPYWHLLGLL